MFGYIRASKPELKVKEYEMYKVVYCSLCKKLGKEYGFITRFALSYDFTFTALLELSFKDGFDGVCKKHCVFNPLKKCTYCKNDEAFSLSAAALVIFSYQKLCDDITDEKGLKRLTARLLKMLFGSAYRKADKNFPHISFIAKRYLEEQRNAEENENATLDSAAEPSSKMMSQLLPLCSDDEDNKKVLFYLGRLIGRYIYLLDAIADRSEDIKKGRYNPLALLSEEEAKEKIKTQLYIVINEAEKSFELLTIKRFRDILGNIIYVGLEDMMNAEFTRLEKRK
ncbi:MAG: DUF5685 family protein [Acutalibacteraceae bacterium]|nr:DUF5685 family protein [Acutalibacteraceae bacterium]